MIDSIKSRSMRVVRASLISGSLPPRTFKSTSRLTGEANCFVTSTNNLPPAATMCPV